MLPKPGNRLWKIGYCVKRGYSWILNPCEEERLMVTVEGFFLGTVDQLNFSFFYNLWTKYLKLFEDNSLL